MTDDAPRTLNELDAARQVSLDEGVGRGRKPAKVFGVEVKYKMEGSRKKSWFVMYESADAMRRAHALITKYPVEDEEVTLYEGTVEWTALSD